MKTSTKLLIIFLACIPASLWAYNSLLKKQLDSHNIVLELRPDPDQQYNEEKLPPFKYLVVNGSLTFNDGKSPDINWLPKVGLGNSGQKTATNNVSILKQYANIVKHHIAHDTLYLSFNNSVKYDAGEYGFYQPDIVKINVADLQEVNSSFTRLSINTGIVPALLFKVVVANKSNLMMNGLIADKLDLTVKDSSEADLNGNIINNLYYAIPGKGKLTMDIYTAKHFYPGKIDSLAWMEIKGKGLEMQQYLK
jgi:hypothetical protein